MHTATLPQNSFRGLPNRPINGQGNHQSQVAIVGTGVVGLAAAVCLAQMGVRVALIGSKPTAGMAQTNIQGGLEPSHFDARVFALSHRSQRLLQSLRVWQAMPVERMALIRAMHIWGDSHAQAKAPLCFSASQAGVEHLSVIVEQCILSQALRSAADFCPNLEWHPYALQHMQAISPTNPAWQLHTEGGVIETPLVLAADGGKSFVRQQQGLTFALQSYNALGVVGTWHCSQPHFGVAHQWFDGDTVLALLPLPGPYVSMVWSMPAHRAQAFLETNPHAQAEVLAQACHGLPTQVLGSLQPCGPLHAYPLQHGMAPVWYQNSVALLGDAAHQMHPLAGQGLNFGLEDVAELVDLLQHQTKWSNNPALALQNPALWACWQRRRKAAFAPMHHLTHGLHGLFRTHLPGAAWLRNQGMTLVDKLPPLKRWLTQQAMR